MSALRGLAAVLSRANAVAVRNAAAAVAGLRTPSGCSDEDHEISGTAVPPPAIAAEMKRIQDDLARVRTMTRTADYADARALTEACHAAAR